MYCTFERVSGETKARTAKQRGGLAVAGRCTDTRISSVRGGYPTMLLAYVLRQTQDAQKVTQENYIGRVFSRSC